MELVRKRPNTGVPKGVYPEKSLPDKPHLSGFGDTPAELPLSGGSGRLFRPQPGRLGRCQKTPAYSAGPAPTHTHPLSARANGCMRTRNPIEEGQKSREGRGFRASYST